MLFRRNCSWSSLGCIGSIECLIRTWRNNRTLGYIFSERRHLPGILHPDLTTTVFKNRQELRITTLGLVTAVLYIGLSFMAVGTALDWCQMKWRTNQDFLSDVCMPNQVYLSCLLSSALVFTGLRPSTMVWLWGLECLFWGNGRVRYVDCSLDMACLVWILFFAEHTSDGQHWHVSVLNRPQIPSFRESEAVFSEMVTLVCVCYFCGPQDWKGARQDRPNQPRGYWTK